MVIASRVRLPRTLARQPRPDAPVLTGAHTGCGGSKAFQQSLQLRAISVVNGESAAACDSALSDAFADFAGAGEVRGKPATTRDDSQLLETITSAVVLKIEARDP